MEAPDFSLTRKDFRLDWYSGTGAGGQHRNKHQNCCRITHIETGTVGQCSDHKDRPTNQKVALRRLVEQLKPWLRRKVLGETLEPLKSNEVVRTYNIPDNRVKDHQSGFKQSWTDVEKDIGNMIEQRMIAKTDEVLDG